MSNEEISADLLPDIVDTDTLKTTEEVVTLIDDIIVSFIQGGLPSDDDFKRAFRASIDADNYMRIYKDRLAVSASAYGPAALHALGKKAATGDVPAIKTLFDVIGVTGKAGSAGTNVMTQVNVNVPSLKDMLAKEAEEIYGDTGNIVEVTSTD